MCLFLLKHVRLGLTWYSSSKFTTWKISPYRNTCHVKHCSAIHSNSHNSCNFRDTCLCTFHCLPAWRSNGHVLQLGGHSAASALAPISIECINEMNGGKIFIHHMLNGQLSKQWNNQELLCHMTSCTVCLLDPLMLAELTWMRILCVVEKIAVRNSNDTVVCDKASLPRQLLCNDFPQNHNSTFRKFKLFKT